MRKKTWILGGSFCALALLAACSNGDQASGDGDGDGDSGTGGSEDSGESGGASGDGDSPSPGSGGTENPNTGGTGGGSGGSDQGMGGMGGSPLATIPVSISVRGLKGSLTLTNGGDETTVTEDGITSFDVEIDAGFDIAVTSAPALQACWVSEGTGTATETTPEVKVSCETRWFGYAAHMTAGNLELWTSDGTPEGTFFIADLNDTRGSEPFYLGTVPGAVLMSVTGKDTGRELWKTDGTAEGTSIVKDIHDGTESSGLGTVTQWADALALSANEGGNDWELWTTDGSEVGTFKVKEIRAGDASPGLGDWIALGDDLIFEANDGINDTQLWISDGTEAGTKLLKNIRDGGTSIQTMRLLDDLVLFRATDDDGGELWKTDGTTDGTVQVLDINEGAGHGANTFFDVVNGKLLFAATDGDTGLELWSSDGTAEGTSQVKEIHSGSTGGISSGRPWAVAGDQLFFQARDDTHGFELWVSDGTEAGTRMISDLNESGDGFSGGWVRRAGDGVVFYGTDGTDHALYYTDGGAPQVVLNFNDDAPEEAYPVRSIGPVLLVAAVHSMYGNELFAVDATGNVRLTDACPGVCDGLPRDD